MKQTAVEWLEERLNLSIGDELKSLRGFFVIAKEMEKQQILIAYDNGYESDSYKPEQYYNDTFKK